MRTFITLLLTMSLAAGQLLAQAETPKNTKLLSTTQAVMNSMVKNPNLMIITGKIVDAETRLPITDAKINFDKFGDELVNAAIDKEGNYALALNKAEIGDPVRIIFKIEGYQRYIAKAVRKTKPVVDLDLYLSPDHCSQTSSARVTYSLSDDPFNTLVIKF